MYKKNIFTGRKTCFSDRLILTQDLNYSDSIRLELLEQAEKELGIEEENVAFWLDAFKMEKLQKEIMPHLMNDIGQKLDA
jgi:coenzyme F420-reducing hydrogenase delta subunit